ncbi:hypothetical protein [Polaromonas sp.]|uniref:hypothetical protein n=1 Tax=Polaromonas sp. TaxID=1869339 RepID=UPI003BACE0C9
MEITALNGSVFDGIQHTVVHRLVQIDLVLGASVLSGTLPLQALFEEFGDWLTDVVEGGMTLGTRFWLLRLAVVSETGDEEIFLNIQNEISAALVGGETPEMKNAYRVMGAWMETKNASALGPPAVVMNSIMLGAAAKRSSSMTYCVDLLVGISRRKTSWFSESLIAMIDIWLEGLRQQLKYEADITTEFPQDEVTVLRYQCVQLVLNLCEGNPNIPLASRDRWLAEIPNDPLPEIRYIRQRREFYSSLSA